MVHEGSLNHWKVQKDFFILCSSIDFIRYSYTSTIKTHNKKQNNGNMGNRVGGKTITQYVAPCNPKQ